MDGTRSPLEVEILAEQVRSLTQATRVLEEALLRLEQAGRVGRTAAAAAGRAALLEEARRRLWNLLVQREAMGIVHHEMLMEILGVPPEVRAGAGGQAARASMG
jgi:hypothetical protein